MKRGERPIIALDLETGGYEPGRHSILAIGVYWRQTEPHYATSTTTPQQTLRLLVEREHDTVVEPGAAAKCGWQSDEQWLAAGALPLRNALDILILWLTGLGERLSAPTFEPLAHNHAGVDRPFLEYWTARYDLREMIFGEPGGLLSHAWHDSMLALRAAQVAGLVPAGSATLDGLLQAMGRPPRPGAHDALEDARGAFDGYHWLTALMARGRLAALMACGHHSERGRA